MGLFGIALEMLMRKIPNKNILKRKYIWITYTILLRKRKQNTHGRRYIDKVWSRD